MKVHEILICPSEPTCAIKENATCVKLFDGFDFLIFVMC